MIIDNSDDADSFMSYDTRKLCFDYNSSHEGTNRPFLSPHMFSLESANAFLQHRMQVLKSFLNLPADFPLEASLSNYFFNPDYYPAEEDYCYSDEDSENQYLRKESSQVVCRWDVSLSVPSQLPLPKATITLTLETLFQLETAVISGKDMKVNENAGFKLEWTLEWGEMELMLRRIIAPHGGSSNEWHAVAKRRSLSVLTSSLLALNLPANEWEGAQALIFAVTGLDFMGLCLNETDISNGVARVDVVASPLHLSIRDHTPEDEELSHFFQVKDFKQKVFSEAKTGEGKRYLKYSEAEKS